MVTVVTDIHYNFIFIYALLTLFDSIYQLAFFFFCMTKITLIKIHNS